MTCPDCKGKGYIELFLTSQPCDCQTAQKKETTNQSEMIDEVYAWRTHNGDLHKEDGPALVYPNGTKHWYKNGKLHREGGPASDYADGTKYWFLNGKSHREDGPAVERRDGEKEWWLEGKPLTEEEFEKEIKLETHVNLGADTLARFLKNEKKVVDRGEAEVDSEIISYNNAPITYVDVGFDNNWYKREFEQQKEKGEHDEQ